MHLTGGCRANVGLTQGRGILQSLWVNVPSSEDLHTACAVCIGVSWADVPVHKLGEVRAVQGDLVRHLEDMQGSHACMLNHVVAPTCSDGVLSMHAALVHSAPHLNHDGFMHVLAARGIHVILERHVHHVVLAL